MSIPDGFFLFGRKIYFYGIISALSYLLGVVITAKNAKKRRFKPENIITLACYVIPLCVIGARIYYVLFSLDNYHNFWDVFKIWEGGLAFYGGLIGGAVGVTLYCLIHKKKFLALCDIIAPALIISQALGRWGNFFNQEAFGYAVTDPKWQFFPFAVFIDGDGWHLATFFYESMWNLLSFVVLQLVLWKATFKENGIIAAGYFVLYGCGRMWIEGLRTDSLYWGSIRVSQALSIIFVVFGLSWIVYYICKHKTYKNWIKRKTSFDKIMDVIKKDL